MVLFSGKYFPPEGGGGEEEEEGLAIFPTSLLLVLITEQ